MTDGPLILCAEDEPQLRRDLAEELREAGYRVAEAGCGRTLLAQLATVTPDLVLCDIMMPHLDGFGVLERLRREYPHLAHVPFVFLTALSMTEAVIRGKRAGADDYLTKPVDHGVLLSTIEARLRQSDRARAGLERQAVLGRHLFETLGAAVLAFDADGRLVQVNPAARPLLAAEGPALRRALAEPVRQMAARARAGAEASVALALPADGPGAGPMSGDGGGDGWGPGRVALVHACPARSGSTAMVVAVLGGPDLRAPLPEAALAQMFALTPTEARVAHHLALGLRPEDVARRLGVAPTTIAFHLRNVFGKTGTHRQADLVALLLSLPLGARPP